jgi:hypothetical protein
LNTSTDNIFLAQGKEGAASVSIADDLLWSNPPRRSKICLNISSTKIAVAILDTDKNKFLAIEVFHFPKSLDDAALAEKLSELSSQSGLLRKVEFREVNVCMQNQLYTFVPSGLFKENDAEKYFQFNHQQKEEHIIFSERIRAQDAVNVFAVSKLIHDSLRRMFEGFSLHHHTSALMEGLHLQYRNKTEKTLFINISQENFEVVVTEGKKLLLCNTFSYRSAEDLLYYILFVCEQLEVNPEMAETILCGEIEKESAVYKLLVKYIRNVSFATQTNAVEFSYGFSELPQHFYYTVFSQILCES